MTDVQEFGLGAEMLRQAADKLEEIFDSVGYTGHISDGDWKWGPRSSVCIDDYTVGEVRAHPDGYLALFFEGEKND